MKRQAAVAVFTLLVTCSAIADDLGTIGPVYDIAERDLIEVIKERLHKMQETGELSRLEEEYKRRVIEGIENPKPIPGIKPTEQARTYYVDPTFTLERNIVDENGRIIYPAGTKVNPFDYDRMSKVLLFFDASDEKQKAFAKRFIDESSMPVKPILVGGKPLELMREWKKQVYFDQMGILTRRFRITHVPAVVSQEDKRIRVDEVLP